MSDHFFSLRRCAIFVVLSLLWFQLAAQGFPALTDSLPHPDSLSDGDVSALVLQWSNQAKIFDIELSQKTANASAARDSAEQTWKTAKQDTLTSKSALDSIASIVKTAKNREKTAQKLQKQASQTSAFIDKVANMDAASQRKNLRKAFKQVKELDMLLNPPPPPAEKPIAEIIGAQGVSDSATPLPADTVNIAESSAEKRKKQEKKPEKTGPKYKPYDPAADVMLNPPARPCSLAVNTRDEFSGETYRETQRAELFRFSNDVMKKILPPGQPHIVCEAALSNSGTTIGLHLHFTIRDVNARKAFGSLSKNSVAILKFIDGNTFTVNNLRNDEGALDAAGQSFTYRAQYALDPSTIKKMRKTELDKIRIAWSTGYEDYEVQNVDLLMRLGNCMLRE